MIKIQPKGEVEVGKNQRLCPKRLSSALDMTSKPLAIRSCVVNV